MIATDPAGSEDDRTAAIAKLLRFLGGADAQRPLVEARLGVPAHRDLRGAWDQAWGSAGVDTTAIGVTAVRGRVDEDGTLAGPDDVARPKVAVEAGRRPAVGAPRLVCPGL